MSIQRDQPRSQGIRSFLPAAMILMGALLFAGTAPLAQETGVTAPTESLLPSRLGPMESLLWSEHGWMRRAFDFPLTTEARTDELRLRRTMLSLHQVGGYVTFASMVTTCVLGQLVINGDEGLGEAKEMAAITTMGLYFATAGLSIFTPPPLVRRDNWSTTSTHKLLGLFHFAGMVITPLIAPEFEQKGTQRAVHQISGYATTAIFGAALLVMTF
jgi:hypothetical protein